MKHAFILLFSLFVSIISFGQTRNDRFDSYESMVGERAIIFDAYSSFLANGPYAFENRDGKFKVLKDNSIYQRIDSVPISIISLVQDKRKQYLSIRTEGETLFLLIDKKHDYLKNARSVSYWEDEFEKITENYSHISYQSPLISFNGNKTDLVFGKYLPVSWFSIQCPKQIQDAFKIENKIQNKTYYWTTEDIANNLSSFLSQEEFETELAIEQARLLAEKKERERLDSIADVTTICEAKILHTSEAKTILKGGNIDRYEDEETMFFSIFGYEEKEINPYFKDRRQQLYRGYALGKELVFPASALSFIDESSKAFIESRGMTDVDRRKEVAQKNDEKRREEFLQDIIDRTDWLLGRINALEKFRQQKRILIVSQEYSFSDYQFGLKFKFYNCYQKEIKYINLTICAYNRVGDLQRDDLGRSKKDVRCIGPLEKGEVASYDFDELFWDDNDIIHRLVVTYVKVTFMDNSVITYSGQKGVELHMADHYAEEESKILHEGEK